MESPTVPTPAHKLRSVFRSRTQLDSMILGQYALRITATSGGQDTESHEATHVI